jgi:hypothetical protein
MHLTELARIIDAKDATRSSNSEHPQDEQSLCRIAMGLPSLESDPVRNVKSMLLIFLLAYMLMKAKPGQSMHSNHWQG